MIRKIKLCITGACGNIAHALYSSICSGSLFGEDVEIELRLFDVVSKMHELTILKEEIQDCCYKNVQEVRIFNDSMYDEAFNEVDFVIFLGGKPRMPGQDRKQVFENNAQIFQRCGKSLDKVAKKNCKCVVVSNPAITNCLVLADNAPSILKSNFSALTRLQYNRYLTQLSKLFECKPSKVKNLIIWGNHSRKQFFDTKQLQIENISKETMIQRLKGEGLQHLENALYERGGFISEKACHHIEISVAKAIEDHIKDWLFGNKNTTCMGVVLEEQKYDLPSGLCFSLPTFCHGDGQYKIKQYNLSEYQRKRIEQCKEELLKERELVKEYLHQ